MDISARATSLRDRPSIRPFGSSVCACAGKTEPSSRLILLQTSGWKRLIGLRHRLLLIPRSSFVRAKSRSFVPARRTSIASRAGAVQAGRCAWLAAGCGVAKPRLDSAEHGAVEPQMWPSCTGPSQSILRRPATSSTRSFSACFRDFHQSDECRRNTDHHDRNGRI
jgi:hypothetical protein